MKFTELSPEEEWIGKAVVNSAFIVHKTLGPGLLEKIYEVCITHELRKAGFDVKRQVVIPLVYDNIEFPEGLRLDILVNDLVIVELKAVDFLNPVWTAQILSQLKLTGLRLGYLINFNVPLIRDGIHRLKR